MKLTFKTNDPDLQKLLSNSMWSENKGAGMVLPDTKVFDNIASGVRLFVRTLESREGIEECNISWCPISPVYKTR